MGRQGERSERRARLHDFSPCPRQESNLRHSVWEPVRNLERPRATCEISRQPFDKSGNAKGGGRPFRRQGGCGNLFALATALETEGTSRRPRPLSAREKPPSHRPVHSRGQALADPQWSLNSVPLGRRFKVSSNSAEGRQARLLAHRIPCSFDERGSIRPPSPAMCLVIPVQLPGSLRHRYRVGERPPG